MLQSAEDTYTPTSPHAFLRHLTSIEPELLVQPTGWEMEEDELWDDLFDSISQEWRANYGYIMEKTFSFDSWVEDFVSLGFYSPCVVRIREDISKSISRLWTRNYL